MKEFLLMFLSSFTCCYNSSLWETKFGYFIF